MVSAKMNIPDKINVGYQERDDTYTGKLAYVVYTDQKGVLRKEKSWRGWCDKKQGFDDFENEPMSGFVLNKGVGGARHSYGWNARNEYIRVYDPRNFEFEISVANLLFILQECSSIKGKGLEGEFVYAWEGKELVLLPVSSKEYQECRAFSSLQNLKVTKNDMKEGCTYLMRDGVNVMYLGRHPYNEKDSWSERLNLVGNRHIFKVLDEQQKKYEWSDEPEAYRAERGFTKVSKRTSDDPSPAYPDAFSEFKSSEYSGDVKSVKFKKISSFKRNQNKLLAVKIDSEYYTCRVSSGYTYYNGRNKKWIFNKSSKPINLESIDGNFEFPDVYSTYNSNTNEEELSKKELYTISVLTENGRIKIS